MDNNSLHKNKKKDKVKVVGDDEVGDAEVKETVGDDEVENAEVGDDEVENAEVGDADVGDAEVGDAEVEEVVGDDEVKKKVGIRKRIRNFIVDKHVDMIKRSGVPLDLACLIIKIIHFRLPFDLFLVASLSSPFVGLCIWLFVMGVFSCFLLLDGCVLSVIEYKLTGNSLNVMDIFLWMFGEEATYENRYKSTIIGAVIYLALFFAMVFHRGGFSKENINKLLYFFTFSYYTG